MSTSWACIKRHLYPRVEAYPQEQAFVPRKPSLEEQLAQLEASNAQLQASQAQCLASQARLHAKLEAFNAQLQASQETTSHSNEQLEPSLAQEPPFTICHEQDSFFDQVEPNSREGVHYEHHEQELPIQDREGGVHVQESELGYESSNASKVRDYISEESVQYWNSNFHNEEEVYEVDSEEENSLFSEEDVELEDLHHIPLIVEADVPKEEESPSIPCDDEEIEEPRTFSPPTSTEIHHELPKVESRTLNTYVLNEKIELKVLLPLNPPFSDQCFYNEVMDWKGKLALNISHHSQEFLPPIVPKSIISTSLEKENARLASRRKIEKKRKIKKLHFWSPIGIFMDSSWSCLYDMSRSPLAPNNRVVLLEKYPP
ncbi:uncharacterized protein LOC133732961 [Rosa rugosa]|uniref:uncharacterized protein LOC133732961 n=1 Tax=Rosa rugosa TaxID=74645 RepID=UPI002B40CC83|nr:uncharacterized protein LOC133732961 [Rosa rugosa]XP_062016548.1 uncharacterized protein LOC133732961 [Rosa rugosa]XP_062016549.1 uncharacterized protein LOC133732961 [Rosa rugosa]